MNSSNTQRELADLRARVAELEQKLLRLADAEERALGAKAQAQALLDNIPHMAWMKDTRGVFLAVNEPFARACSHPRDAILGKTDKDIWPLELAERYMLDDQRVIESGEKFFVEEQIPDGGGVKWFETFKTPIRDRRRTVIGTVGLARDITDRKQAQERMLETQKLESLGVLAGGIAHDFNNLLVGVLANAELALEALRDETRDPTIRERIEDVRHAARHAADLTNQMLAYSGRGRFDVRPISLTAIIREMSHLLGASTSKKARVVYDLEAALPAVQADVTQMRQVIMNLITNASDAFDGGNGTISVRTTTQQIDGPVPDLCGHVPLPTGTYACLEVIDDGCGMSEETRARLFEPYFTTKFMGRGLGLSAVQGIVRGHKGGIAVRSAAGVGTGIKVLLPCSTQPAEQVSRLQQEPLGEWFGSGLVLLVDDDLRVRSVTGHLLRSIGFEVVAFGTGQEAIAEFKRRKHEIRIVVLDVTMPDLNGDQVLKELRRMRQDVPVLLCSGYTEDELSQRFTRQDMAGFLQKPYCFDALRARLRSLME